MCVLRNALPMQLFEESQKVGSEKNLKGISPVKGLKILVYHNRLICTSSQAIHP